MKDIPLIHDIDFYTQQFCFPDITTKNYNAYKDQTDGLNGLEFITLCDPQTSGGLLVSVSEDTLDEYYKIIHNNNPFEVAHKAIGRITMLKEKWVYVR